MMNFNYRIHVVILFCCGLLFQAHASAQTLVILGDSLSAGYQLPSNSLWAVKLAERLPKITIVNASISGDTSAQGLARLSTALEQHKPRWVLIELGANDGLRGLSLKDLQHNLAQIITQIQQANAMPILMQIRIPPNYGRRYTEMFDALYPQLAKQFQIEMIPFYLEAIISNPEWMLSDGLHPNERAQPVITDWMLEHLVPLLK